MSDVARIFRDVLVDGADYAFGSLSVVCGAVSEGPEVGERGLGVNTCVGQAAGFGQRDGDVTARLAGEKDIAGLFTVADGLLLVMQRAVDVAEITVDVAPCSSDSFRRFAVWSGSS